MKVERRKLKKSVICPITHQFKAIIVCAYDCKTKCELYQRNVTSKTLDIFIEKHPEYELIGELMPKAKKKSTAEKIFWIKDEEGKIQEVTENEVMKNPKEYLDKDIFDKPTYEYNVIISLKRKKL
ncbi:MAG: hypothetical protein U9N34_03695 [Candidatus Cloacimonadota bacterium]|nr:hypothetical protein [Candidatus Cloacimonadota bacterium]